MRTYLTFLFSFFCFLFSCNTKQNKFKEEENKKSTQLQIDTTNYLTLPYCTDSLDKFKDTYLDTFSVGITKFRFVNPFKINYTGGNSLTLQKLINNQWTKTNLTLEDSPFGGNYFHDKDINGDGYKDIVCGYRYIQMVYFYNPEINNFFDTAASEEVNPEWFLLDKKKNIYCDFQEFKGLCNQIHSNLYTYNGFNKIYLFDLTLYNCTETNNQQNIITKLILKTYINSNKDSLKIIEVINLDNPINKENKDEILQYSDKSNFFLTIVGFGKKDIKNF